jgi:hypothetical protein
MSTLIRFEDTYGVYSMYERISSINDKYESIGGYSNSKIFSINEKKGCEV